MSHLSLHPFDQMVQQEQDDFRLAEACLYFACDHDDKVDIPDCLARLSSFAERVALLPSATAQDQVYAIRTVLVDEELFFGGKEQYDDPRNSLLHEVLDRKTGLPILLSAVWLDVAASLEWPFFGVGLPGHFIISRIDTESAILIDPFHDGRILTPFDCEELVENALGKKIDLAQDHLRLQTKREILFRMLHNLRTSLQKRDMLGRLLSTLDRMLALMPDNPSLQSDREATMNRLARWN